MAWCGPCGHYFTSYLASQNQVADFKTLGEELALSNEDSFDETHVIKLAFVCKKMLMDVCGLLVGESAFHITDLETLKYISLRSPRSFIWNYVQMYILDLHVTLRLPLSFYQAFEASNLSGSELAQPDVETLSMIYDWNRLWAAVCDLQALRNLHVWHDHDLEFSWSLVKERPVLLPVFATFATRFANTSRQPSTLSLKVIFNLPKLHPNIAKPYSHFVSGAESPTYQIDRRIRQRYHFQAPDLNSRVVKVAPNFPTLWYLACEEGVPEELREVDESLQLKELEAMETMLWSEGTDPVPWDMQNRGIFISY